MEIPVYHSRFAPAERAAQDIIHDQTRRFLAFAPLLGFLLDTVPDILMALNPNRQIIFANRALQRYLGREEHEMYGLRPGEALDCIHAAEEEWGCGTTEFCSTCGAVRAILASQAGQPSVQECRITRCTNAEALDLRVQATPFMLGGDRCTFFVMTDISHEKRRRALERIFFHDVLNTATAVKAASDILARARPDAPGDLPQTVKELAERLTDEIVAQRQLTDAENDELAVNAVAVDATSLVCDVAKAYGHYAADKACGIRLRLPDQAIRFVSDPGLLRRVLGNMLKNALEASRPGEPVILGCEAHGDEVEFWVHNGEAMPRDVQLQVFQRSFSTKGTGRGLGTYSMKLLTERYLGGRISFTTSPEAGTTFQARYPRGRSA
jgi:signal transduction histidine kinase